MKEKGKRGKGERDEEERQSVPALSLCNHASIARDDDAIGQRTLGDVSQREARTMVDACTFVSRGRWVDRLEERREGCGGGEEARKGKPRLFLSLPPARIN